MRFDPRLNHAWWTLRIGFGLLPIAVGVDKYFNVLANWEMYLDPRIPALLHVSSEILMRTVSVVEIVVGLMVLTRFTRIGAYFVMAWLLAIAVDVTMTKLFYDIALRDVALSLGAFALAKLTEARLAASNEQQFVSPRKTVAVGTTAPVA